MLRTFTLLVNKGTDVALKINFIDTESANKIKKDDYNEITASFLRAFPPISARKKGREKKGAKKRARKKRARKKRARKKGREKKGAKKRARKKGREKKGAKKRARKKGPEKKGPKKRARDTELDIIISFLKFYVFKLQTTVLKSECLTSQWWSNRTVYGYRIVDNTFTTKAGKN